MPLSHYDNDKWWPGIDPCTRRQITTFSGIFSFYIVQPNTKGLIWKCVKTQVLCSPSLTSLSDHTFVILILYFLSLAIADLVILTLGLPNELVCFKIFLLYFLWVNSQLAFCWNENMSQNLSSTKADYDSRKLVRRMYLLKPKNCTQITSTAHRPSTGSNTHGPWVKWPARRGPSSRRWPATPPSSPSSPSPWSATSPSATRSTSTPWQASQGPSR